MSIEIAIAEISRDEGARKQSFLRQQLADLLSPASQLRVTTGPEGGYSFPPPSSTSSAPIRVRNSESVVSPMEKQLERNFDQLRLRVSAEVADVDGARVNVQAAGKNVRAADCSVKGARSSNEVASCHTVQTTGYIEN